MADYFPDRVGNMDAPLSEEPISAHGEVAIRDAPISDEQLMEHGKRWMAAPYRDEDPSGVCILYD